MYVVLWLFPWLCLCVTWIHAYLSRADQNHDDKMSYEEVQTLLQMINIDLSDQYAHSLFQVTRHTLTLLKHVLLVKLFSLMTKWSQFAIQEWPSTSHCVSLTEMWPVSRWSPGPRGDRSFLQGAVTETRARCCIYPLLCKWLCTFHCGPEGFLERPGGGQFARPCPKPHTNIWTQSVGYDSK